MHVARRLTKGAPYLLIGVIMTLPPLVMWLLGFSSGAYTGSAIDGFHIGYDLLMVIPGLIVLGWGIKVILSGD